MRKILVFTMLIVLALPDLVAAQQPLPAVEGGMIVATGFNGPQGISVGADGSLWVIESGIGGDEEVNYLSMETGEPATTSMGQTARIVKVSPDGEQNDTAALPSIKASDMEHIGGGRLAWLDGVLYATSGAWLGGLGDSPNLVGTVVRVEGSEITQVADLWAYEEANNPDGFKLESHPYGMAVGPDGWLWIAESGANTLMRIDPASGAIEHVATFGGLPGAFPNNERNNAVEADPVPTAVAFDDAGNAYVSLLSGFPFVPGTAKVVRVTPEGEVSDYATGLTMLTDLRRGPDGELYAVQFGMFTEQGPAPDAGALVRVKEGDDSEILVSGLSFPTSLAFDQDGNAFVTINGLGAPGSGAVVRFDGLTSMQGEPLPPGQ